MYDGGYYYDSEGCVNDDSTTDSDGGTCSMRYDSNPGDCGSADDEDFTASEQCCACAASDDNCVNDDSTTDAYGYTCSSLYDSNPIVCDYSNHHDDEDFTASLQCCACGGYLGKTLAPTISAAPTAVPSTAVPTTPAPSATPCVDDDSTEDLYGYTCSSRYDSSPSDCGCCDDDDFTASEQCCACGGGTPCRSDDSTTDAYGYTCSSLYDINPIYCQNSIYYDDDDFKSSEQCCACGGGLRPTSSPTATLAPSTSAPSLAPTIFSLSLAGYALATNVRQHARIDEWMQQLEWKVGEYQYNTAWVEDAMLIYANGGHSVDDSGEIRTLKGFATSGEAEMTGWTMYSCVAEAPVPAASTVEAEAPAAPDKQRCRAPPSLGVSLSGRPRTAPTAPSLGVSTSGPPRAVIRQGEPRDPGGSLRVRAMAQRAVARPLHAGPPSRRPPPLQPSRRPSSR